MTEATEGTTEAPVRRRSRRWLWLPLLALLGVGGAAILKPELVEQVKAMVAPDVAQMTDAEKPAPPPAAPEFSKAPVVTVARATKSPIAEAVIVSGTLVPREEVMVAAEVDGLAVTEILVDEGDTVKKNQALAKLSRATIDTQLAQNTAQIARAEAAIAQAESQIAEAEATRLVSSQAQTRAKTLQRSGYTSEEKLDQAVSTLAVSEARLLAAKRAVDSAKADKAAAEAQRKELDWRLARTEVRSPVAGIIKSRSARIGQIAAMAAEPLFRIIADGKIELEAEVSDVDVPRLTVGQLTQVLPSGAKEPLEGRVRLIAPEIDRTTRLGRVRIWLKDGQKRPAVGSFARGTIETARRIGIVVPLSAVSYGETSSFVQVVKGGVVRTRPVKIGLVDGARVEVALGLDEGEEVVARAGSFLRDGDRVTTSPEEAPEATQ